MLLLLLLPWLWWLLGAGADRADRNK